MQNTSNFDEEINDEILLRAGEARGSDHEDIGTIATWKNVEFLREEYGNNY